MTGSERDRVFSENYGLIAKVLKDCGGFFGKTGIYTRDDLVQIGSIGLLKAIDSFRPDKKCRFSTYAYVLIRNELINEVMKEIRRHGMETVDTEDDFFLASYAFSNSEPLSEEYDDILHILGEARENAPEGIRTGIDAILLIAQDYSGAEIAKMFGIKPGNVRVCVSRARKYLRENGYFNAYLSDRK